MKTTWGFVVSTRKSLFCQYEGGYDIKADFSYKEARPDKSVTVKVGNCEWKWSHYHRCKSMYKMQQPEKQIEGMMDNESEIKCGSNAYWRIWWWLFNGC